MDQWTPRGCLVTAFGRPILIGVIAGILGGLLGVGAGVLMVPAMMLLLHLTRRQVHGISLAVILLIALSGAFTYKANHSLLLAPAIWMTIGVLLGTIRGTRISQKMPRKQIRLFAGVLLILVAPLMICLGLQVFHLYVIHGTGSLWILLLLGLLTGFLSGFIGIGGGILVVPALVLLLHMNQLAAQGISLIVITPAAVSGALIYTKNRDLDYYLTLIMGAAGAITAYFAANWAHTLPIPTIQLIFGIFLALMGISIILREFVIGRGVKSF